MLYKFKQKYNYVLHPRTTGFTYITKKLIEEKALDSLYDVTLLYCDKIPQNETYLLSGDFPKIVKLHFVRYPVSILPHTEHGLKDFLEKRWAEKEMTIKEFYATGNFLHGSILKRNSKIELYFVLIFWTLLPFVVFYIFITFPFFTFIVTSHTSFMYVINFFAGGYPDLEININMWKRRLFRMSF